MTENAEAQESFARSPGLVQALLLSIVLLILLIVVAQLLSATGTELDNVTLALITQLIVWPPILWVGVRRTKRPWSECFPLRPCRASVLVLLIPVCFGAAILMLEVFGWLPGAEAISERFKEGLSGNLVTTFVFMVLVGPFAEELFFRGWMLGCFLRRYSVRISILTSALLFAAFHVDPWYALMVFPLGLFFGWLVVRTNSLIPALIGHLIVNGTSFSLPYLLGFTRYDVEAIKEAGHLPPVLLAVAFTLLVVGGWALCRQVRNQDHFA